MAWLIKKKLHDEKYVYYIAYRVKKGNHSVIRTKTTKTDKRKLAQQLLYKFEQEQESGNELNRILLSEFYESYLKYSEKQKSRKTYLMEKNCLNQLLSKFGDFYLDLFSAELVNDYKFRRNEEICPTSVNVELRMIRSIFNYALSQNYVKRNPFSKFKKLKEEHSDSLPIFMTLEEMARFRKVIDDEKDYGFLNYVDFLLRTGARRSEILSLEYGHIDLESRLIMLTKTKTKKPRYVPVDDKLYEIIQAMEQKPGKIFGYHPDTATHKFQKYLKKAGLEGKYSLKTTRKTFASHLVMNGVDLTSIQEILGHEDPKITSDHYAKLSPEHLKKSIKKLPY